MKEKTFPLANLQLFNIIAYVAVVAVNVLSNALPLNGRTAGEISDSLPSYFTPAGYTFSIWGLIYTALLAYTVYQALPAQRENHLAQRIGWLFIASCAANSLWIFAWHYEQYVLSIIFMVSILLILIATYLRLEIGFNNPNLSTQDKLFLQFPFSLYLGWITVATIANIASVLNYLGWNGFGIPEPTWSAIMMAAATIIAGALLFNRRNLAYAGVLVWALFGIRAAYLDVTLITTASLTAAAFIILFAIIGYIRTRQPISPLTIVT